MSEETHICTLLRAEAKRGPEREEATDKVREREERDRDKEDGGESSPEQEE